MRCWVCFTESTQYLVDKIFYDHRWFFQRKLILIASSTGKFLQNSCSEQLFRKLTGRSASVHKKNSTTDILLGVINEHFGLKKMVWYDKYMGPFKMCITQEREEGSLTKKSNKKWCRRRVRNQWMWSHSLKKNKILRVMFFLNGPYVLLCCIFYEFICWWCH